MAVKYRCTKCDRKFVEWGVAKVKSGQACENCHGEYLQLIGYDATQAAPRKKPALKRKRVRVAAEEEVAPTLASFDEDEATMPDLETLTSANAGAAMAEDVEEFETTEAETDVEVDAAAVEEEEEGEPAGLEAEIPAPDDEEIVKSVAEDEEEEEDEEV